jgi:tetratricopeptide (TPR) repeat protein
MIVMAALNLAGYDYEAEGTLSPLRARLRQELASMDRGLRGRLAAYFQAHKMPGVNDPAQVAPYVALALVMNPPPSLSVTVDPSTLPFDVRSNLDFAHLARELYLTTAIGKLARDFSQAVESDVRAYRRSIGQLVFETINYLHTQPTLTLTSRQIEEQPAPDKQEDKEKKQKGPSTRIVAKERVRRLHVILDPLNAGGTFYIRNDILNAADETTPRRVGDDYFVTVGFTPSAAKPDSKPNLAPVRTAFLRFMLEPLAERFSKKIRELERPITALAGQIAGPELVKRETASSIVTESLVRAVEARMNTQRAESTKEMTFDSDEAVFYLSEHYRRGAVLAYHFYEKLAPWEPVGVDLAAYYEELVHSANYDREAKRLEEYRAVLARVEERRAERARRATESEKRLAEKFLEADGLIKERRFEAAQPLLEAIIKEKPTDARALFGLAQVKSQLAAKLDPEKSDNPDETQKQLTSQLQYAIELYRQAIKNASDQQKWLISQAHVSIGKVLEFLGEREAAIAEYKAAAELGDVPGGAYAQAKEGLQRPLVK